MLKKKGLKIMPHGLQVYYVITDVATMVQEVADHQDMLRSLSESKLFLIFWIYSHSTIH